MTVLDHAMTELRLAAVNDCGEMVNQVTKTLSKKHQSGEFLYERAIGYVERQLVLPAAKNYALQHCSMTQSWRSLFPKALRMQVAEDIVESMLAEFRIGNYWD